MSKRSLSTLPDGQPSEKHQRSSHEQKSVLYDPNRFRDNLTPHPFATYHLMESYRGIMRGIMRLGMYRMIYPAFLCGSVPPPLFSLSLIFAPPASPASPDSPASPSALLPPSAPPSPLPALPPSAPPAHLPSAPAPSAPSLAPLPVVEDLKLEYGDAMLKKMQSCDAKRVKTLTMNSNAIGNIVFEYAVNNFSNLEKLTWTTCQIPSRAVEMFARLPVTLTHLSLRACRKVRGIFMNMPVMENLRCLDTRGVYANSVSSHIPNDVISGEEVVAAAKKCQNLQALGYSCRLTVEQWNAIFEACPSLNTIMVGRSIYDIIVGNLDVMDFTKTSGKYRIRVLDVSDDETITTEKIRAVCNVMTCVTCVVVNKYFRDDLVLPGITVLKYHPYDMSLQHPLCVPFPDSL